MIFKDVPVVQTATLRTTPHTWRLVTDTGWVDAGHHIFTKNRARSIRGCLRAYGMDLTLDQVQAFVDSADEHGPVTLAFC
jgi:hypothetical protein